MLNRAVSICRWTVGLCIPALLVGCAPGPLDEGFADAVSWADRQEDSLDMRESLRGGDGDEQGSAAAPDSSTTLALAPDAGVDDYVQLALRRSPAIRAAQQRVERFSTRIRQARSLEDPMIELVPVGDMAQTAAGEVGLMAMVSQTLPFPGKLGARGRIASREAAMAQRELAGVRLAVAADTRDAYWNLYFATRAIAVTEASRALLNQFRDVAQAKLSAGTATQQDVLRASVELSSLDSQLLSLRQQQTTATAMLNSLTDRAAEAPIPAPAVVQPVDRTLELKLLLAQAAQSNPEIAKGHEQVGLYREQVKLARLNRWPNLTVSLAYNAVEDMGLSPVANGEDQWWVGFGFNVPIWLGRLSAAQSEARHGVIESLAELKDTHNRVAFRVQDALVRVQTSQRQVALFRDAIVPQSRQAVDAALSGYRAGKVDFLTLADNWRKLLEFDLMYHRSVAQLEQDFAQLQRTVGEEGE